MRFSLTTLLIVLAISFDSCDQAPAPTAPRTPQGPKVPFSMVGYGSSLDSAYFKVWSDSSWEEFLGDTTINGTQYLIITDNVGNESLYGPKGYSGFGQFGNYVVLFDSALASLPDTMTGGTAYSTQTTFTYQGVHYVLIDQETLVDTTTVSVPFGTFTNCRVLQSVGAMNGAVQYSTISWLAQGPSDIARQYSTNYGPYGIQMAYGVVNGEGWGMNTSNASTSLPMIAKNAAPNIQRIAPMIVKGMITFRSTSPSTVHSQSTAVRRRG